MRIPVMSSCIIWFTLSSCACNFVNNGPAFLRQIIMKPITKGSVHNTIKLYFGFKLNRKYKLPKVSSPVLINPLINCATILSV